MTTVIAATIDTSQAKSAADDFRASINSMRAGADQFRTSIGTMERSIATLRSVAAAAKFGKPIADEAIIARQAAADLERGIHNAGEGIKRTLGGLASAPFNALRAGFHGVREAATAGLNGAATVGASAFARLRSAAASAFGTIRADAASASATMSGGPMQSILNMTRAFIGLQAARAAGNGVASFAKTAEEAGQLDVKLKNLAGSEAQAAVLKEQLTSAANRQGVSLKVVTAQYDDHTAVMAQMGATSQQSAAIFSSATDALRSAGEGSEGVKQKMDGLNKIFADGKVNVKEFNKIVLDFPQALSAMEKSTGKTTQQLRTMAADGKLGSETLARGFIDSASEAAKAADAIPLGFSQATNKLGNAWQQTIGRLNQTTGFADKLAAGISRVADMLGPAFADRITATLGLVGAKLGGVFESIAPGVARAFSDLQSRALAAFDGVVQIAGYMVGNVTSLFAGLFGGSDGAGVFSNLVSGAQSAFRFVADIALGAFNLIASAASFVAPTAQAAMAGIGTAARLIFGDVLAVATAAWNGVVSIATGGVNLVNQALASIGLGSLGEVATTVAGFIGRVIDALLAGIVDVSSRIRSLLSAGGQALTGDFSGAASTLGSMATNANNAASNFRRMRDEAAGVGKSAQAATLEVKKLTAATLGSTPGLPAAPEATGDGRPAQVGSGGLNGFSSKRTPNGGGGGMSNGLKEKIEALKAENELTRISFNENQNLTREAKIQLEIEKATTAEMRLKHPELVQQLSEQIRIREELKEQKKLHDQLKGMGEEIGRTVSSSFMEMAKGGQSFGQTLKKVGASILEIITQTLILKPLIESIGRGFGGLSGGGGGGFSNLFGGGGGGGFSLGSLFGFAKGGAFDSGGVTAYAKGGTFGASGIVDTPTMFNRGGGELGVMGEAGPEAIMPLSRSGTGGLGVRTTDGRVLDIGRASSGHLAVKPFAMGGAFTAGGSSLSVGYQPSAVSHAQSGGSAPGSTSGARTSVGSEGNGDGTNVVVNVTVTGDATADTVERFREVARTEIARATPQIVKRSVAGVARENKANGSYMAR